MAELSLKGRALAALARREHSRVELQRKLAPHTESAEQLTQLLDQLEAENWLSSLRFAESLTHRRAAKFGTARIQQELHQHDLAADLLIEQVAALRATESARALVVWEKKFGELPQTPQQHAKQMRFLLGRGFSAEAISQVLKGAAC